jgi:hypothetical protein
MVATIVAAALLISGAAGWMLFLREPEPVAFRLAFPKGESYLYRVESTSSFDTGHGGTGRKVQTQMEGLLKLDVERAQNDGTHLQTELTLFSFAVNGSSLTEPRRIRQHMHIGPHGSMLGGIFSTSEGLPVLLLPALSPLLPEKAMQPGDEQAVGGVPVFSRQDALMDGTTRFVGYEEVDGVQLAVLHGVLSGSIKKGNDFVGTGEMRIDIRARIDLSTGTVHDVEGTVRGEQDLRDPDGERLSTTDTFRLLPMDSAA